MNVTNTDVYFSAQAFSEEMARAKVAVVIDVLRATSTMVTALANGAKGIIPVRSMGDASQIVSKIGSDNFLLCGEKDGIKIENFDLGNSPFEYDKETVSNKTIVLTTTNGTNAIQQATLAQELYLASFLNVGTVINQLKTVHQEEEVILICSGWKGRISIEDTLCAGYIIDALFEGKDDAGMPDGAKVAKALYNQYRHNLKETILQSNHAKRLEDKLVNDDIGYCSQIDIFDILPILKDGIIVDGKTK
jgi:2-phosphosulfolactate phosphatase